MSNKTAAAYHGAPCNGSCCKNPMGVCYHGHACQHHLREEVRARAAKPGTTKALRNLLAEAEALTGVRRA